MPFISRSAKVTAAEREQALAVALRQTEPSRRLSIYDRATGFLAPWYFVLRATEETSRSTRYKRPLSLITLEARDDSIPQANVWLSSSLRTTDLVCQTNDGRYFLLLPETDARGAYEVAKRLIASFPVASVKSASMPSDGESFKALLEPLALRFRAPPVTA